MDPMQVFDARAVRRHRDRAAALLPRVRPVLDDLAARLLDRLDDTTHRFTRALEIGGRGGVADALRSRGMAVVSLDASARLAGAAGGDAVCGEAEFLPFADGSFDLVVSSCALHWVNDLPGALIQIRRALRPDGLFSGEPAGAWHAGLAAAGADGGGGGVARRGVTTGQPVRDLPDCAALLQRAGFALPVADVEEVTLLYADPWALLLELRAAGETNAVSLRDRAIPPRALFGAALAGLPVRDGRAEAVLRLAFLTGWAPAPSQPRPLARGSGRVHFGEVFGAG